MTTIVIDRINKIMAADCQTTWGNYKYKCSPKIIRLTNPNRLIATVGSTADGEQFFKWVREGMKPKSKPKMKDKNFNGVILYEDGTLHMHEEDLTAITVEESIFSIGSGSSYALGAIFSGKSCDEAIQIASSLDVYTGLGVQVEKLC